jgi:hypothetical protein
MARTIEATLLLTSVQLQPSVVQKAFPLKNFGFCYLFKSVGTSLQDTRIRVRVRVRVRVVQELGSVRSAFALGPP